MNVSFAITEGYRSRYPEVGFGLVLATGCENPGNPEGFDAHKRKLLRRMRKRETLAEEAVVTFGGGTSQGVRVMQPDGSEAGGAG
jgi:hypothetical protein